MMRALSSSILALALLASGCGGEAVVERDPGAGGAGGAGASTSQAVTTADASVSVTASTGTGASCDTLGSLMRATLEAATACNACKDFDGCIVPAVLHDDCGCEVHGNGSEFGLVEAATQAYDAWVAAGCGPNKCGKLCPPVSSNGFCATDGAGTCSGHCAGG